MIRLITATPGSGKTCIVVEWLLREIDKGFYKSYYCNISNLRVCGVRPLLDDWRTVPDELKPALIIVDEAQYHEEFMKETTKNNEVGKALSTHRHYGVDLWLITQSPKLLNAYVLENTGEHVHLYRPRKKKTVTVYWWSYAVTNLAKSNFQQADDVQKWRLNPIMFDFYKSTVAVTDGKARTSQKVVTTLITFTMIAIFIIFMLNKGLSSFTSMQHANAETVLPVDQKQLPPQPKSQQKPELFPEVQNTPLVVSEFNRVASVFASSSGCRAYNGNGDLINLDQKVCFDYSEHPYKLTPASDKTRSERLEAVNYQSQPETVVIATESQQAVEKNDTTTKS
jgi:zona occludens toxin